MRFSDKDFFIQNYKEIHEILFDKHKVTRTKISFASFRPSLFLEFEGNDPIFYVDAETALKEFCNKKDVSYNVMICGFTFGKEKIDLPADAIDFKQLAPEKQKELLVQKPEHEKAFDSQKLSFMWTKKESDTGEKTEKKSDDRRTHESVSNAM